MTPYDGSGYGRSLYWQSQAKDIAKLENEICSCFESHSPIIDIRTEDGSLKTVKVKVMFPSCDHDFQNTERRLTEKFKEFYQ